MEQAQEKVEKTVTGIVDELDRTTVRKHQLEMYRCSAKCCEDSTKSVAETRDCIMQCGRNVEQIQNYLATELSQFQNRIERCAMDCQDDARRNVTDNMKEGDFEKVRASFNTCLTKCVDKNCSSADEILKKMKETIKGMSKKSNYN